MKTKEMAQEMYQVKRNVIGLTISAVICAAILLANAFIAFLPQDLKIIAILAEAINLIMLPFQIDKLTAKFSNLIFVWEMAVPVIAIATLITVAIVG